jgi:hypothetical protein
MEFSRTLFNVKRQAHGLAFSTSNNLAFWLHLHFCNVINLAPGREAQYIGDEGWSGCGWISANMLWIYEDIGTTPKDINFGGQWDKKNVRLFGVNYYASAANSPGAKRHPLLVMLGSV